MFRFLCSYLHGTNISFSSGDRSVIKHACNFCDWQATGRFAHVHLCNILKFQNGNKTAQYGMTLFGIDCLNWFLKYT